FRELNESNAGLQEALEQQTATAEVLAAISRAPTDLQSVLDTIARSAQRLTGSAHAVVHRLDGDDLAALAMAGWADGAVPQVGRRRPRPDWVAGRCALEGRTVHVPDVEAPAADEFGLSRENGRRYGFRAMLNAPRERDGEAVGVLGVSRADPGPYS